MQNFNVAKDKQSRLSRCFPPRLALRRRHENAGVCTPQFALTFPGLSGELYPAKILRRSLYGHALSKFCEWACVLMLDPAGYCLTCVLLFWRAWCVFWACFGRVFIFQEIPDSSSVRCDSQTVRHTLALLHAPPAQ